MKTAIAAEPPERQPATIIHTYTSGTATWTTPPPPTTTNAVTVTHVAITVSAR